MLFILYQAKSFRQSHVYVELRLRAERSLCDSICAAMLMIRSGVEKIEDAIDDGGLSR